MLIFRQAKFQLFVASFLQVPDRASETNSQVGRVVLEL